ncbi:TPA: helix-turn-helix transcriptional regulator [Vibrio parahaemolyticus]|nr:helix-turn-helix transcriptional regulator [Vibrio parahaemolyticus]HCE2448382.1 helix-turn-helix transcriptional regulator [Vibrio parahaemolyticus]
MKSLEEISTLLADQRRKLGIEQKDMYMRIGMKQQQYQRIEAGSDVKLSTLLRVLEGLDLELSISPKQIKGHAVPIEDAFESQGHEPKGESLQDDEDDLGFWFGSEDK